MAKEIEWCCRRCAGIVFVVANLSQVSSFSIRFFTILIQSRFMPQLKISILNFVPYLQAIFIIKHLPRTRLEDWSPAAIESSRLCQQCSAFVPFFFVYLADIAAISFDLPSSDFDTWRYIWQKASDSTFCISFYKTLAVTLKHQPTTSIPKSFLRNHLAVWHVLIAM